MNRRFVSLIVLLSGMCLLLGCESSNRGAKVIDPPPAPSYEYRVKSGDTLYSIAWRHEMNYVELARMNNIAHPYTIYPDQILKVSRAQVAAHTVSTGSQDSNEGTTLGATPVIPEEKAVTSSAKAAQPPVKKGAATPAPVTNRQTTGGAASGWAWPSTAKVSKTFGPNNKGVNFALGKGSEVHAARSGTVVYASTGIGGYRNLVIIRHDERYLSAYSLDQGVLVKEGQSVGSGDTIARIAGEPGRDLHFEVRDRGEPVDPMKVLKATR